MFRGRYEHALDEKGRLALPATFKKELAARSDETLMVTKHLRSPCLVVYATREWLEFEEKVGTKSQFDPAVMLLRRLYMGNMMPCSVDKVGRVLLPQELRDHAGLERDVVISGQGKTAELWSPARWRSEVEAQREVPAAMDAVLGELAALGL
jgi:MraZ protein